MSIFDSIGSFFTNDIPEFITETVPNMFSGGSSSATDVLADVGTTVADTTSKDPSFWSKLGDSALSPEGLTSILGTGLGLYKGLGELDLAKKQEEAARLAEKNNMLLAMAKLKAGSGGGGGGGGGSRLAANQAIIDAVRNGQTQKSDALNKWVNNYMRAYGK